MKKSGLTVSFLRLSLLLFLITSSTLLIVAPTYAADATVGVFPSSIAANESQSFSVNINITNVADLYGWEFRMNWTSTVLDLVGVSEGSFLKTGGSTFFYYKMNATQGHITADGTLLGNIPGVSGSGILATLTFSVKSSGSSPLNLYYAQLIDSLEQTMSSFVSGGSVTVLPQADIAVIGVGVSPTVLLPGNPVNINATVQNLGTVTETFSVTAYANMQAIGTQGVSLNSGGSQTLFFPWDTTGLSKGDYNITAVASTVPGETNTANNAKAAPSIVTILYDGHDVAVTGIKPSKTVIGQGYGTSIKVIVKNYGIYSETFDTSVYLNATVFPTQTVSLLSGSSAQLTWTWNTTAYAKGRYALSAYASTVPGETNTTDNTMQFGTVMVTVKGDINGDGRVDITDAALLGAYWHKTAPPAPLNVDINGNGIIDVSDAAVLGMDWQKHI